MSLEGKQNTATAVKTGSLLLDMWAAGKAKKYAEEQERYRNDMRMLQEAHSQDAITINEIYSAIDTKNKNLANEVEYQGTKGALVVQAAVGGFSGRTSDAIANAALRAKQLRTTAIEEGHDRSRRASDIQRLNSAFGTQLTMEDGWVEPVNYLGMTVEAVGDAAMKAATAGAA